MFAAAVAALAATGILAALALRLESFSETLLVAYVAAWTWLVVSLTALSLVRALGTAGLWIALTVGLGGAGTAWLKRGRPPPPSSRSTVASVRAAFRDGRVVVLGVAVGLGVAYSAIVGVSVAANDGDALAYHLPRALLWRQQEAVGWIADASDPRLNVMPPVSELGQLATMLASDSDRFVAIGELVALVVTTGAVACLARRLGSDVRGAVFGALLFASLPVVILQAASALNDLVVCSFLACAAALLLSANRSAVLVGSLSTALAVGTKVTAWFGLPWIALLVLASARSSRLRATAALAAGALLGSGWYAMNLWHTRELDGGYADASGQRQTGPGGFVTTARNLGLDLLDRSGVNGRDVAVYWFAALVVAVAAVAAAGLRGRRLALAGAALVALVPVVLAPLGAFLLDLWQWSWKALGRTELANQLPTEFELPVLADATDSWYGPVLAVCLILAPVAVLRRGRSLPHRRLLVAMALAPPVTIVALAAVLTYDPYRGRFLMFAVVLAAATWGSLLRWPTVAWGVTALGIVSAGMSLAMSMGKPTGLVLLEDDPGLVSRESIWGRTRVEQQGQLRPGADEIDVLRFVQDIVPEHTSLAVVLRDNDYLSPFFGESLGRRVVLVPPGNGDALGGADWLVTAPRTGADQCPDDWRERFGVGDWKVLERVGRGGCGT